ncbi:DUF2182 domain-containing protein [Halocalculus aciditolerans]|nr:DUF2182 domain-containing protein [Halocalculus aciditolerans]
MKLDRGTTVVVAMILTDIVWWWLTWAGETPMPGMMWVMKKAADGMVPMAAPGFMELGVFHVGTPQAIFGYVVMWGVMMWAMMHPAMTRFTRDYAKAYQGGPVGAAITLVAFLVTYHLVWALSALLPLLWHGLLVLAGFEQGIFGFTRAFPHASIGGILVLCGIYQLTGFKGAMLRSCCANVPLHSHTVPEALREGLSHGVRCCAISFGVFFLVMPFFGEMNFFWMAMLTLVITAERLPSWGREIAAATGVAALLAGLYVLFVQPDLGITWVTSMSM